MRARNDSHDSTWEAEGRSPNRAVWSGRHGVKSGVDAAILCWISRLVWFSVVVPLAVAVCVEDERRPALRFLFVTRLVEHLCVEPADDRATAARPQGSIRVFGEHQMVRAEARVDVRELFRFRVVHR